MSKPTEAVVHKIRSHASGGGRSGEHRFQSVRLFIEALKSFCRTEGCMSLIKPEELILVSPSSLNYAANGYLQTSGA